MDKKYATEERKKGDLGVGDMPDSWAHTDFAVGWLCSTVYYVSLSKLITHYEPEFPHL